MADGYSLYTGNPAGGSNTNPKPGAGFPQVLIPADGYVPTSAMFQQFEQTLADFAAYNSQQVIQINDGYSQKALVADGIGGINPSTYGSLAAAGDGYIFNKLTVGGNTTLTGATTMTSGFTSSASSTATTLTASSLITTEAVNGITGPVSGHLYKALQPIAWGWVVSGASPSFHSQVGCASITQSGTGIYQIALNTSTIVANSLIVVANVQATGGTPGSCFCLVRYTSTSAFTIYVANTSTYLDNDFSFVVHGLF